MFFCHLIQPSVPLVGPPVPQVKIQSSTSGTSCCNALIFSSRLVYFFWLEELNFLPDLEKSVFLLQHNKIMLSKVKVLAAVSFFFLTTCRWSDDILIQAVKRDKQPHTSMINCCWPLPLSLCKLSTSRGQCIFNTVCHSHFLHEIPLPQSTYVPNVKFCLNFSLAVAERLIIQPNCLDPSPRRDPSSPSIPSGVSWTPVCIWVVNHLQLLPFIHQTVTRTTSSPFEFSACPCCSLQRGVLA